MLKLAHGAEAVLYLDQNHVPARESLGRGSIIKERLRKGYRLPHLDESLRQFRTRREAKILQRLEELNFPAPRLQEFSDQRRSIVMDFVPGEKVRDVLGDNFHLLAKEIGQKVGKLHQHDLIHGDLTTSNLIQHAETGQIHFLDFGLASFSGKVEDKAVDLFLLERALASKHYSIYPEVWEQVLAGYKEGYPGAERVLERLEQVRRRGRNKGKGL
ncbi:MAG: KEOPS complex kinase/ATPase Bud32 [Nanoarchaeota archaeon]